MNKALDQKVRAINTFNEYAEKLYNQAKEFFAPLEGTYPFKVDGSLLKKYSDFKLETYEGKLPNGDHYNVHGWIKVSYGYVDLNVKLCLHGGSYDDKTYFCIYEGNSFVICKVENGRLVRRDTDDPDFSTRYDTKTIEDAAEEVKKYAAMYDEELEKVPYQFRDVLYLQRLR